MQKPIYANIIFFYEVHHQIEENETCSMIYLTRYITRNIFEPMMTNTTFFSYNFIWFSAVLIANISN